ncbi:hypothetical protein UPYG_G00219490 [Umbra pygmaea]|uniref:THD domain-containing protein n=1 Tax=Umbra pygmaea TaxID=75934 RepID=A0ABD0WN24_UMBPY
MQNHALVVATISASFLSCFLVYQVTVLQDEIQQLRADVFPHPTQPEEPPRRRTGGFGDGWERSKQAASQMEELRGFQTLGPSTASSGGSIRVAQQSFLQLSANTVKQPFVRGNVTMIPWTVALRHGEAVSITFTGDTIIIHQDGFFILFGQVLFRSPGTVMGHIVRRRKSNQDQRSTELLHCLQVMPPTNSANTCYTSGILELQKQDELELVIPDRPQAQVSMDADCTFFGIIQLN